MFNAVGGSTIHWSAHFPRFHPSDFRVRVLDGVADDWPLDYAELEPFYDLNDRMMGVSGIAGDPAQPAALAAADAAAAARAGLGARIARGFDRSAGTGGRRTAPSSREPYDGRAACNNCGPCGLGCPTGRQGQRPTSPTGRAALALGVRAAHRLPRARDHRSTRTAGPRGALLRCATARCSEQQARAVVVGRQRHRHAAPAAELALAPLPGRPRQPQRPGRQEPDVPPLRDGERLLRRRLAPTCRGPLGSILMSQEFYETDLSRGFVRGYSFQMNRSTGPARTGDRLHPAAACRWGEGTTHDFDMRFGNSTILARDRRGSARGAQSGRPRPRSDRLPRHRRAQGVLHAVARTAARMMEHGVANGERGCGRPARTRSCRPRCCARGGWHLMGTARMGDDPKRSVVDRNGQAHDVDNLHRRWQRLRDRRRGQPDADDPGDRASHCRLHHSGTRRPARPVTSRHASRPRSRKHRPMRKLTELERQDLSAAMDRLISSGR